MDLTPCNMPQEARAYTRFVKDLYAGDEQYIDYVTPLMREVFSGKSAFSSNLKWQAYWIIAAGQKQGVVTFLVHCHYPEVLQLCYFEYKNQPDIAGFVFGKAKEHCQESGLKRIVIGMNGHVNYGLGLSHGTSHRPSFCAPYSKLYYSDDFRSLGLQEIGASSYLYPQFKETFPMTADRVKRLAKGVTYRAMTRQTYRSDMAHYTALNNSCFAHHDLYYPREESEDLELFGSLRFFLTKGSLIFAEDQGRPIGFLLWYPDWSEVMRTGETLSVRTFLKRLFFIRRVKGFKLVEWAVLPEYRRRGVPIGLLYTCYQQVIQQGFRTCSTSWILDENKDSNGFGHKWGEAYAHYRVFSLVLEDNHESLS